MSYCQDCAEKDKRIAELLGLMSLSDTSVLDLQKANARILELEQQVKELKRFRSSLISGVGRV